MTYDEARWRLQLISEFTIGSPLREQQRASDARYTRSQDALGVNI